MANLVPSVGSYLLRMHLRDCVLRSRRTRLKLEARAPRVAIMRAQKRNDSRTISKGRRRVRGERKMQTGRRKKRKRSGMTS